MRKVSLRRLLGFSLSIPLALAQTVRTVPTFTGSFVANGKHYSYTMAGHKPELGGTTTIPTVVVPLSLSFDARAGRNQQKVTMSVEGALPEVLRSPIFRSFSFATGNTQYGDAVQRAQFYKAAAAKNGWHTLLG